MMARPVDMQTLHAAVFQGDLDAVKLSLAEGDNPNAVGPDHYGRERSVLGIAAHAGHGEIVRSLLEAGAEVDAADEEGNTALIEATCGNLAIVALLLEHGANVNVRTVTLPWTEYYGGATPLIGAVKAGKEEVVRLLLDHGADIDAGDDAGMTPLLWITNRSPETGYADKYEAYIAIIRLLLERGADVNRENIYGTSALDQSESARWTEVIELLKQAGAERGHSQGLCFCFRVGEA